MAVKVLDVAPEATVTEAGTERLALASDSATTAPPAGAGWERVTLQVLEPGVAIVDGEQVSPDKEAVGARLIEVFCDPPFAVTVTVAVEELAIVPAVAEKFAVVALAATVTEAGTVRRAESEETSTASPPAGAAFDSVTVQVEAAPEVRVEGAHVTLEGTAGALNVKVKFWVTPL